MAFQKIKGAIMKIWEKGYTMNSLVEEYTVGNDYILDKKLVKYDCLASIAHAEMLGKISLLNNNEVLNIVKVLEEIIQLGKTGEFTISKEDEDCHTAIENYLILKLGDTGKKIHTARSRNDQVLTALRLYYKDELGLCVELSKKLINSIGMFTEKYGSVEFPGYTHTRKAMPSSIKLWSEAFAHSMQDNIAILNMVYSLIDQSPLGTGAGFGVSIEIDREFTAKSLGFKRIQENSIYAQMSRGKFESMIINGLTQIMFDINRLSTDLIFFSLPEHGYIELLDSICSGSSIMPQKKNPDVLEIMRGNYHVLVSNELQVKTITANQLSGYNRDVQLTKEPVMRSFEITKKTLEIAALVFDSITVNKDNCRKAMTSELYAAEKAYELVKEGIPFRDAYKEVAEQFNKNVD